MARERPLTVVEVSERGWALLERCRDGTGPLSPGPAEWRFLRRLAELGIVELRPAPATWPAVSVVVPARDRPRSLAACLRSVAALRYPGRLDVTVVDDGSAAPLAVPAGVRLVRLASSRGPAGARDIGARGAVGDVLAFLDSDCRAEPDWLSRLVAELADPAVAAAGGRVLGAARRDWLERYEAARSPLDLGSRYAEARPRTPVPYLVSASMVVRRTVFEEFGGFDPALRFGEDVDLCWRLDASGLRMVYQPLARVMHEHRGTLAGFVGTRAAYGGSEAALLRRHPRNRRWLAVRPASLLAAGGVAVPALLPVAAAVMAWEVALAGRRLRAEAGLSVGAASMAVTRGHAAMLYHAGRQLCRYYGLPLALLALRRGPARRLLLAAWLGTATADWLRLRPGMSLPGFAAAQALDDLSYQAGCLLGCLRDGTTTPLRVDLIRGGPGPAGT